MSGENPPLAPTNTVARKNAVANGQEGEFDAALDAFCDEWNRGSDDAARFEQEYLVVVGKRR